jgi:hypothetical protein
VLSLELITIDFLATIVIESASPSHRIQFFPAIFEERSIGLLARSLAEML